MNGQHRREFQKRKRQEAIKKKLAQEAVEAAQKQRVFNIVQPVPNCKPRPFTWEEGSPDPALGTQNGGGAKMVLGNKQNDDVQKNKNEDENNCNTLNHRYNCKYIRDVGFPTNKLL